MPSRTSILNLGTVPSGTWSTPSPEEHYALPRESRESTSVDPEDGGVGRGRGVGTGAGKEVVYETGPNRRSGQGRGLGVGSSQVALVGVDREQYFH